MFLRAMTVVLLATFAPMTSALGQETTAPEAAAFDPAAYDLERGKVVYEKVGICLQCHGWDGDGLGRNPRSQGEAARLRESALTPEQLREVVACGRPYTPMPYHDAQAYNDDRCYGMTMADFAEGEFPDRGKSIRAEDIDNLVAYMVVHMVGKPEATLADCEEFYAPGHRNCQRFTD